MKRKIFLFNIFLFMIVMTGCNSKKKYTIYFVSENTLVKEISTRGNELIELPQNIVKEGYELENWYFDDGTIFSSSSYLNCELTSSIIVTAKWIEKEKYSLCFVVDNKVVKKVLTCGNELIELPQNIVKEGYELENWYFDDGTIFSSSSYLNCDLTSSTIVTAKWIEKEYKIDYILSNEFFNDNPTTYKISDEDILLLPIEQNGYQFIGWYTDKSLDEKYKIEKIKTSSLQDYKLYPKWERVPQTLTYMVEEEVIYVDYIYEGNPIELYNYDNFKWYYYKDNELVLFDYIYMPDCNLVVYGMEPKEYEVTFNTNGGEYIDSITYQEGESIYLPIIKYKNYNYIFNGWYYNDQLLSMGDENIILNVNKNIEIKAFWKETLTIDFTTLTKYNIESIDDNDTIILDFLNADENLYGKNISIKESINTLILNGKAGKTYYNFSITVASRKNNINIVFNNFSYKSKNTTALYAKSVGNEFQVVLEINGVSSIKCDSNRSGTNGKSYNMLADVNSAKNGGDGTSGNNGYTTIEANNLVINCLQNSLFNIYGGAGGNGGSGGDGQGSNGPNKANAGNGGSGGRGGNGGNAIDIYYALEIMGSGILNIYGGTGGNGGNGGNGGHATVNYSTDNPDNGGAGGSGGIGGNGGQAICFKNIGNLILHNDIDITLYEGNGGTGGNGGNGGNTVKTLFYDAGKVGAAGVYGNGGVAGNTINKDKINNSINELLIKIQKGNNGANGRSGKKGVID